MKTGTRERRERLRSEFFRGRKLWIEYRRGVLAAKVVDSSDHGLGVEIPAPLEVNSFVSFAGVGLRGRAQVKHCRRSDDDVFRAGFNLEAVSFRELDVPSRVLPSETVPVHDPRDRLLNAGAIGEPKGQVTDNLVKGGEEVQFNNTQDSSEEESQANGSGTSISQLAGESIQEERALDGAGQSGVPDREGEPSAILSEMAKTMSQGVEVALLNLELHRANEIKAIKQELGGSKLNEILQRWPETQQQIAELKANVSEQQAGVAAAKDTLSQLRAETETAQQLQANRVDSILERLPVQEAELPKLKDSIEDLSGKLDAVVRRLDFLSKALHSLYEVEKQRQTTLQQLSEVAGSLKATLPTFPEELADSLTDQAHRKLTEFLGDLVVRE